MSSVIEQRYNRETSKDNAEVKEASPRPLPLIWKFQFTYSPLTHIMQRQYQCIFFPDLSVLKQQVNRQAFMPHNSSRESITYAHNDYSDKSKGYTHILTMIQTETLSKQMQCNTCHDA